MAKVVKILLKPSGRNRVKLWGGGVPIQARIQDFLKGGGGGEDIHKHPPLDIVRVTSSTFQGCVCVCVIGPGHAHFA